MVKALGLLTNTLPPLTKPVIFEALYCPVPVNGLYAPDAGYVAEIHKASPVDAVLKVIWTFPLANVLKTLTFCSTPHTKELVAGKLDGLLKTPLDLRLTLGPVFISTPFLL
jgi:hypothetical protein